MSKFLQAPGFLAGSDCNGNLSSKTGYPTLNRACPLLGIVLTVEPGAFRTGSAILSPCFDPESRARTLQGNIKFQVKSEGYDSEKDLTQEPEENVAYVRSSTICPICVSWPLSTVASAPVNRTSSSGWKMAGTEQRRLR